MKSDINTLEPEFSKEEWRMIKDYLKHCKKELKYPTKPEISIGGARYPLGRFTIRKGLIQPSIQRLDKAMEMKPQRAIKFNPVKECLLIIQTIIKDLRIKGKSVKSVKRKKYEGRTD